MKIWNKQVFREALLSDRNLNWKREDAQQEQEKMQKLSARELWKNELKSIYDPGEDMTEEEHAVYQKKLMAKLKSGKKLTAQEMNYLRVHDPAAYRMARRIEYKRLKLEQKLKHCQSKEEAEEVYNQAVGSVSEEDPDKEALLNTYRVSYEEFKKTMEYASLPETKREAKAERLHGKKKKAYLEGKDLDERNRWFEIPEEGNEITSDSLVKLEEEAVPLDELLDSMPVMDITG